MNMGINFGYMCRVMEPYVELNLCHKCHPQKPKPHQKKLVPPKIRPGNPSIGLKLVSQGGGQEPEPEREKFRPRKITVREPLRPNKHGYD